MKFDRDAEGCACVITDSEHSALGRFLQSDVQEDLVIGRELLGQARGMANRPGQTREFVGNTHQLTMSSESVAIRFADDEQEQEYPLDYFVRSLSDWLKFVS